MAVGALSTIYPTYLDFKSREDPDGKVASSIVELSSKTNEILSYLAVKEGNLETGNRTTVRTGLPTATWRLLNYGVQPTKSVTAQVDDTCGMLEAYAEVDRDLAALNGNTAAWRLTEASAHIEAMNQQMSTALIYGAQATNPEQFTGFMPRYPKFRNVALDPGVSSYNCLNNAGAGVGTETSIYLAVFGPNTGHAFYPKGSQAVGIKHESWENITLLDADGGRYQGHRDHFKWDMGLAIRDWRYFVRICNIDSATISASVQTVIDNMITAYYTVPNINAGNAVFLMNNLVLWSLVKQARATPNLMMTWEDFAGKGKIPTVMGIPLARTDAILNTEAVVLTA